MMENSKPNPELFFEDGQRRIDLIIAYEFHPEHRENRTNFEKNLRLAGLHLELVSKDESFDRRTNFLKIHIPNDVMDRNADFFGMKPPVKNYVVTYYADNESTKLLIETGRLFSNPYIKTIFDCDTIQPEPEIFLPGFTPNILDKYVIKERCSDFTPIQRTQIVWQILSRVRYDDHSREKCGIQRLLTRGVYTAAYPLHSGDHDSTESDVDDDSVPMNERRLLYLEWATVKKFYKKQPLWLIKHYFGVKVGLYFAWLGFYTKLLVIPAIIGVICFLFGAMTMNSPLNKASEEICDESGIGNFTMCPQCDYYCPYWKLSDSCYLSRITYLFDNNATVFFSIFMSFWATTFLELWKRRQQILKWEWDLGTSDDSDHEIRPEFENGVKNRRMNPITQKMEAYLPGTEKTARIALSYTLVIVMLTAVLGMVFSIILFRLIIISVMYQTTMYDNFFSKFAKLIATGVAGTINAIVIEFSGVIFQYVARRITNLEHPRTQSDYENGYTIKMFLFQFINYYSSLIYTAFFKGRFFTYPGDAGIRSTIISRLKADMCDPAGCLYEICILLAIYMIARQLAMNTIELYYPKLLNWWRRYIFRHPEVGTSPHSTSRLKRWEADYTLQEMDRLHLFDEYIEMVIQYGFVTLFVAAFPLAPLLALLNNIFEIRLDAYKYTTQMRRPLGQQVQNIGIWYGILEGLTYVSVVFNAFVIAWTSDFIPRMVYVFGYSEDFSLTGYINSTLSLFNTTDWKGEPGTDNYYGYIDHDNDTQTCRYRAYRTPPHSDEPYIIDKTWLHVFVARLVFVVIFEHLVLLLTSFLSYAIPDVPNNLRTQIARENLLLREAQFDFENSKHFILADPTSNDGTIGSNLNGEGSSLSTIIDDNVNIKMRTARRKYRTIESDEDTETIG